MRDLLCMHGAWWRDEGVFCGWVREEAIQLEGGKGARDCRQVEWAKTSAGCHFHRMSTFSLTGSATLAPKSARIPVSISLPTPTFRHHPAYTASILTVTAAPFAHPLYRLQRHPHPE